MVAFMSFIKQMAKLKIITKNLTPVELTHAVFQKEPVSEREDSLLYIIRTVL